MRKKEKGGKANRARPQKGGWFWVGCLGFVPKNKPPKITAKGGRGEASGEGTREAAYKKGRKGKSRHGGEEKRCN